MELLLNLAWLLLALPAYWLWRGSRSATAGRKFTSLQCLLALGCMLVILFPVISATDDLRAMGSEMEESPVSKRSVRQASPDKAPASKCPAPPALAGTTVALIVGGEGWLPVRILRLSSPATPALERAARAPPRSFLA
ncbi:MAG TPA: hypothetical protein VKF84_08690 [Candidatus Sulfotelmatobacter sp.]|nr:hypothetical protein [Candidatus Sulfotelmatobacter sp.]